MNETSQITFTGEMQTDLTIGLTAGWNYLPVLNPCDNITVDLFNQIIDNLQIVKEVASWKVYWPQFGVTTLDEIVPGKAYFVLVDENVNLEFPVCDGFADLTGADLTGFENLSGLTGLNILKTPLTHTIAIPQETMANLTNGDIICIYGANGQCFGAVPFIADNLVITAFGDDPTTPKIDGMTEGEIMQFRIFNPETGKEYPLNVEFDQQMPHSGYFVHHGLSAVKSMHATGIGNMEENPVRISIYPNPSSNVFNICFRVSYLDKYLSGLSTNWEVTDMHGSVIALGNDQLNGLIIDLSSHPKGIYYLKITKGGFHFVEKLVLQ